MNRDRAPHHNGSALSDRSFGHPVRFLHIKDLQHKARVALQSYGTETSIRKLLDTAEEAAKRVAIDVTFKRPDQAYVSYLTGSDILVNLIPKNKDFVALASDRGDWDRRYRALCKQSDSQHAMIKQIYDMIVEDNARTGIRPQAYVAIAHDIPRQVRVEQEAVPSNPRPLSMPASPTTQGIGVDELFLNGNKSGIPESRQIPARRTSISPYAHPPRRERPAVQPKPRNLRLHPIQLLNTSRELPAADDKIVERFARLRIQRDDNTGNETSDVRRQRDSTDGSTSSELTSPSSESSAVTSHGSHEVRVMPSPTKPFGPRGMPTPSVTPAIPPKIPLSPYPKEQHQILPQAPKPSYDPTKSTVDHNSVRAPSLNRKPSVSGIDERTPRPANHLFDTQALPNGATLPSRSSSMQPPQNVISAEDLHIQCQKAKVLLIDVRSREDYDSGHIMAKSIICVEPVGMRSGMSAEELEERLVNSPAVEQALFERIHEFDLVVYYDQSTQTDRSLTGPPTRTEANHLRALHDTLCEFNDYKPLRRPPLMLSGGLEAWVDLMGPQALTTSKTAAVIGPTGIRRKVGLPRKPLGRLASASANSSLEVRKRRLREQKPLNADEERSWLEKAQQEEVTPAVYEKAQSDSEADRDSNEAEPLSPFVHSYEDFLRRFPEPASLQMSAHLAAAPSRKAPPSVPPPPPPPPDSIPAVPSRPPPAFARPSYGGVSDQITSQYTPLSRQMSASQQPFYTSRTVSRYRRLPRTGLINFGVTCYMNATIQCLLATIPLSQFFLGDQWRNFTQKNWKGSNGILPEYFANLIRTLWSDDSRPVRPSSLRSFCARLKDEWGVDRQQDAKEFFDFIVDCLHEDLNLNYNRTPLRMLTDHEERIREGWPVPKAAKTEWDRYLHRESSFISDLFAGQHASRLRCTTCNSTSTTYEPFYSVSVEIPRASPKRGMWDIHSCLRSYCHEEKLSGDEVWKCPHCKKEREATKQITITRAPKFLVVHFKRFEMRKGDAKKVHTPINFPLYGLDLSSYMVGQSPNGALDADPDVATTPPYVYDCYAVMRHIGNTGYGGHYISFVRDAVRGCWRKFDDDRVSDFDPAKLKGDRALQNEQAYLLFYMRTAPR